MHYIVIIYEFDNKHFKMASQLLVALFLRFVLGFGFSEEHSADNLELSLSGWSGCSADFQLALEWAVLPVGIWVLVIFWHFHFFVSVLVDELEDVASEEIIAFVLT